MRGGEGGVEGRKEGGKAEDKMGKAEMDEERTPKGERLNQREISTSNDFLGKSVNNHLGNRGLFLLRQIPASFDSFQPFILKKKKETSDFFFFE